MGAIGLRVPGSVEILTSDSVDHRYGPFASVAAAKAAVALGVRYDGLEVKIIGDGSYHWLQTDLTDTGLIRLPTRVQSGNGVNFDTTTEQLSLGNLTGNANITTSTFDYKVGIVGVSGGIEKGFGLVGGSPSMFFNAADLPNTLFTNQSTLDFAISLNTFPKINITASNNITGGVTMYFVNNSNLADVGAISVPNNTTVSNVGNLGYMLAASPSLIAIVPNNLALYPYIKYLSGHAVSGGSYPVASIKTTYYSLTSGDISGTYAPLITAIKNVAGYGITNGFSGTISTLTNTWLNHIYNGGGTMTINKPVIIAGLDVNKNSIVANGGYDLQYGGGDFLTATFSRFQGTYTGTGGGGAYSFYLGSTGSSTCKFLVDTSGSTGQIDFRTTTQRFLMTSSAITIISSSSTPMFYDSDYDTSNQGDQAIPDVAGVKMLLGNFIGFKSVDALVQSPSVTENGYVISWDDGANNWTLVPQAVGGGGGSVNSVGLVAPAFLTVSGSPVTVSGNLTLSLATQSANLVWAGPATGSAAAPTFRSLVAADIPNSTVGIAKIVASGTASSSTFLRGDGEWSTIPSSITNGAGTNEIPISSGGNLISSKVFSPANGDMTFGDTGLAGSTRTLLAEGSSSNVGMTLKTKGTGLFIINAAGGLSINDLTNVYNISIGLGASGADPIIRSGRGTTRAFTITTMIGDSSIRDGANLNLIAADADSSAGNGKGGDLLIQSGLRRSAGTGKDGNITIDPHQGWVIMPNTSVIGTPAADTALMFVGDIAAGNAAYQFKTELGQIIKLYTTNAGAAYSISNGSVDRTYDASSTSANELADILYTLIQDLKLTGIIV